jgi:uncharacterized protein (DUF39 family)
MRTIAEINDKISRNCAVVWTVEELKARVVAVGVTQAAKEVDVITTGTFEPMESSGAIINLGHTDPPIKIRRCWLDNIPAYSGFERWICIWEQPKQLNQPTGKNLVLAKRSRRR